MYMLDPVYLWNLLVGKILLAVGNGHWALPKNFTPPPNSPIRGIST